MKRIILGSILIFSQVTMAAKLNCNIDIYDESNGAKLVESKTISMTLHTKADTIYDEKNDQNLRVKVITARRAFQLKNDLHRGIFVEAYSVDGSNNLRVHAGHIFKHHEMRGGWLGGATFNGRIFSLDSDGKVGETIEKYDAETDDSRVKINSCEIKSGVVVGEHMFSNEYPELIDAD
ncbi:hypothetical protein [Bdellovibrio svalbardensis]|uniref:Organic solvent tolerance-like N-terminal domain-containing protein n=1 Tax=Bdellovibrio svalbardensis TaxID=2972972 RepID=A0ABT6DR40_9BACT|nr:hypothetical protein [Bdellovibrio svalbardensis]MDG0818296.1 hypothetical protein [Bdellovibrio svalbardensis]